MQAQQCFINLFFNNDNWFVLLPKEMKVQECDATNVEKWFWSQAKNYFYLYNSLLFKPKHFKKRTIYFKTLKFCYNFNTRLL